MRRKSIKYNNSKKEKNSNQGFPFKVQMFGGFNRDDVLTYLDNLIKKFEQEKIENESRKNAVVDLYCDTKSLCEDMINSAKKQATQIRQEAMEMKKEAERAKYEAIQIKAKTEEIKLETDDLWKNIQRIQEKAHSIETNADTADTYAKNVSTRKDIDVNIDDIKLSAILDEEYSKAIGRKEALIINQGDFNG